MIIKIGDEYLDFNADVEMERQIMNVENFENVGDFSYSFTVPPTSYNKRLLRISGTIDEKNKSLFNNNDRVDLQTNEGITVHTGSIIVTDSIAIECSFVSGNTGFFDLLVGDIRDVDLSEYDVEIRESNIVSSWSNNNGVVFPIVDRGNLSFRKDPFMILYVGNGKVVGENDFQPFIYIKNVIKKALTIAGLKLAGDLLSDKTYLDLITTNNDKEFYDKRFKENSIKIGKTSSQTLTTTFSKITFQDDTSVQYYNSDESPYNFSDNRWETGINLVSKPKIQLIVSDPNINMEFEIRRNGDDVRRFFLKGSLLTFDFEPGFDLFASVAGDYYELWGRTTSGTLSVVSGVIEYEVVDTNMVFASALLPDQKVNEFVKDIFKLFNVICSYDDYTKTINTRIFKNLKTSPEQDLSDYLQSINSENGFDVVSDYARENLLEYSQQSLDEIDKYNNEHKIEYGSGSILIDNKFLEKTSSLHSLNYVAPYSYFNPYYGLQLLKLNYSEYKDYDDREPFNITDVTDDLGRANFHFSDGIYSSVTADGSYFVDDAEGNVAFTRIEEIESSDQILALNILNVDLPIQIKFSEQSTVGIDIIIYRPWHMFNFTIEQYNGYWMDSRFIATTRPNASVAVFAKYLDGSPLDTSKQGLAFGEIEGKDSLTIIDTYYRDYVSLLNDPVKIIAEMLIPEHVYFSIDFLRPVRIKTDKFNSLFFLQKITGYKNSYTPCTFELIKL